MALSKQRSLPDPPSNGKFENVDVIGDLPEGNFSAELQQRMTQFMGRADCAVERIEQRTEKALEDIAAREGAFFEKLKDFLVDNLRALPEQGAHCLAQVTNPPGGGLPGVEVEEEDGGTPTAAAGETDREKENAAQRKRARQVRTYNTVLLPSCVPTSIRPTDS